MQSPFLFAIVLVVNNKKKRIDKKRTIIENVVFLSFNGFGILFLPFMLNKSGSNWIWRLSCAFYEYLNSSFNNSSRTKTKFFNKTIWTRSYYSLNGNQIESVITFVRNKMRLSQITKKRQQRKMSECKKNSVGLIDCLESNEYKIRNLWEKRIFKPGDRLKKERKKMNLINMRLVIFLLLVELCVCLVFEWRLMN